jgi:hypothetical protein
MIGKKLILINEVPENLLSGLESRDVALWIRSLPEDPPTLEKLVAFLTLPWRLVFSEVSDPGLVKALEEVSQFSDPMTRKRGFVQMIDTDPSRIELPQRCLPFYLANGRQSANALSDFESRLRRMTMLEDLRRSGVRQILVISGNDDPVPPDLKELWRSGFRSHLTFVSDSASADVTVKDWIDETLGLAAANLSRHPTARVVEDILARYTASYPEDRRVIRVRDHNGILHNIDVTETDEPERPIFEQYSLLQDRDLAPLLPEELSEEDFVAFFQTSCPRPSGLG